MKRWMFSSLACAALFALGASGHAEPAKKIARIGYLSAVSAAADEPRIQAFRQELLNLGYVEGKDIVVEYRREDREFAKLTSLAAELTAAKVDVIVTVTTNAALAAKKNGDTVPIVF